MSDLFSGMKEDFKIVRLTSGDVLWKSDHFNDFSSLILENLDSYPKIDKWLNDKVSPQIGSSDRTAYVGYFREKPIVSAVLKLGPHTKFCHLKISDDLQNHHLGELFFSLMTLEARELANDIHFTLPSSLWAEKQTFFRSFGFEEISKSGKQYRLFDEEMRCSAPLNKVWESTVEKLPKLIETFTISGHSMDPTILMSIKPNYAERILNGQKKVEIRKKFSSKWVGHRLGVYASKPLQSFVGEASIENVFSGTPEEIWGRFESQIGCSREEFDNYVGSKDRIYAIILNDVLPYSNKIPLAEISWMMNEDLRPPQSYCGLDRRKPLGTAMTIAALLQDHLRYPNPLLLQST